MSVEITPEHINSIGLALAGVIGAVTTWQAKEVKKLRARVDVLEAQSVEDRKLFKSAVRYIRDLLAHVSLLTTLLRHHAPDVDLPDPPAPPDGLQEEI